MPSLLVNVLLGLFAVLGGFFQFSIKPKLDVVGWRRVVTPVGNTKCKYYDEAQACEKIVLHEPTGQLYMACSTQDSRRHWTPALGRVNATGKSMADYVAVFDPATEKIKKLQIQGFKYNRGLSVLGMDIVPSKKHPGQLLMYLVNHRQPLPPADPREVGADSTVEVFHTTPGSDEMHFVATYKNVNISTPNDIVAGPEDMSFYFTNDYGFVKAGLAHRLKIDLLLGCKKSNVGYCDPEGCSIVADSLCFANGIVKDRYGKYFVASAGKGVIYVLERQDDRSFVVTDEIPLDRGTDNLSFDESGALWAAGIVDGISATGKHIEDPSFKMPSSAFRITLNDGEGSYFGEKYKVDKVFEDDGTDTKGATSVAYDVKRNKLYLHGLSSPHLTVCDL